MNWLNRIMLGSIVAVLAMAIAASAGATKIAVVDTAKVVKEYEKTKEAQERLEKELDDKKSELRKMSEDLENEKNGLERQKGIVSEKKYKKLLNKFEKKQDVFRDKYRETQSLLMKKQRTLMEGILNDVRAIVAKIAKKEKYDLVLEKETTIYHNGQDLTYKVLDALNSK